MNDLVTVTLEYTPAEARRVVHLIDRVDRTTQMAYDDHDRFLLISSAIRRATPPPKPLEPTGLGAVVRDTTGALWVRWCNQHRAERCWKNATETGLYLPYEAIVAVEILSPGVTS